jgi:hypothetical protein
MSDLCDVEWRLKPGKHRGLDFIQDYPGGLDAHGYLKIAVHPICELRIICVAQREVGWPFRPSKVTRDASKAERCA